MKTSEIYKLKLLRDMIICESKYSNIILTELKKENHNNISFYNILGIELKCKNYYNSIELIDEFLYNNFNVQNGQSLFSENVKAIYSINIDILKLLLNVSENNLKFYRCKIKEDFLIHFSDDKKYSILIPKKLTEKIKDNRNNKIDIFIDISNKFNTNYIINVFQNVENESYYNYLLENEKKLENSDFGPQSYGYSSWDDFAFNTAFEGDIDAWNEYNQ